LLIFDSIAFSHRANSHCRRRAMISPVHGLECSGN
jgi:hypothetical protein